MRSKWAIVLILVIAAGLRFWRLADWSLWEDEETTIYFSQHLSKPFPSSFPIFFMALKWIYDFTGIAVDAGRALPAIMGILAVWLTYICFRRLVSREAALLAALLIAINLGHLFWSQSIRYYTMVVVFQLMSIFWFLKGFETGRYRFLVLSNLALGLALLTHHTAVLLVPVFFGFVLLMKLRGETGGAYHDRGYLVYGIGLLVVLGLFAFNFFEQLELQVSLGDQGGIIARAPTALQFLLRCGAYFGLPVIGLAIAAAFLDHKLARRIVIFFLMVGVFPIASLTLIAIGSSVVNTVTVNWYYAMISLFALTVLAAISLVTIHKSGRKAISVSLSIAALAYYTFFLTGYFTDMYGDRPRWQDATEYLQRAANIEIESGDNPDIFATVPGVTAYYLGVNPAETMGHPLVERLPAQPRAEAKRLRDQWFVVKSTHLSPEWREWFADHCTLTGEFEAHTGPRDRTLLVYHYKSSATAAAAQSSPQAVGLW